MNHSLGKIIKIELERNVVFKEILEKFEVPELDEIEEEMDLVYKSNEYMGYYKKELYFDLINKKQYTSSRGTLKVTFVSNVKQFDIEKAMHKIKTEETHIVSVTFMIYNDGNDWDTAQYNYTLWK